LLFPANAGGLVVDGSQEFFGIPGSFFFFVAGLFYGSAGICPGVGVWSRVEQRPGVREGALKGFSQAIGAGTMPGRALG
jgi:hypothetical protein